MTGRSAMLRVQDVRDAYRVIGACRDTGSDPALWQRHMFEELARLFGGVPATGGEGRLTSDGAVVPLTYFDIGFDAMDLHNYLSYMRAGGPAIDPFVRGLLQAPANAVARTRRQVVADREYYRSLVLNQYLRAGNVHHRLASIARTMDGRGITLLHLHRPRGEQDFSARERTLLEFFHRELGPLVGRALVSAAEPTPLSLAPRLRQTLACLAQGDTEKQVAARLGVSVATAHQYVTALYRRFGVNSRGQLLAHVMKRITRREWRETLAL